jgi:hypothetical protein
MGGDVLCEGISTKEKSFLFCSKGRDVAQHLGNNNTESLLPHIFLMISSMKKTTLELGVLALTLGVIGASASMASAYRGDASVQGPNYSVERHDAMTKAFESKDYNAWKELMQGRGNATRVVNADNFSRFAEMHQLTLEGKSDEAQKIRQELGVGLRNGSGNDGDEDCGMGGSQGRGMNR